jgi:DNA-binding response OmpR family regulator
MARPPCSWRGRCVPTSWCSTSCCPAWTGSRSCAASGTRQVLVEGREAQLTQREFDLLLFLARHPGRVFNRNQLMDAVWQYSFYSDTSTVTVHIRRLRAKIERGDGDDEPRWIQTVWGVGYRFSP